MAGRVTGIGGFFFRSKDAAGLAAWYQTHLGINPVPTDYDTLPWMQEAGPTVFTPFAENTDYFGRDTQQFMINLRVTDMDDLIARLTAAGIEVASDGETNPNGRFARIHDPDGNPVELWEPAPSG